MFTKPTFLYYFDPRRQLYINVNASKRFGFSIMIYYVKRDPGLAKCIKRGNIEPILFLSKLLTLAEKNY